MGSYFIIFSTWFFHWALWFIDPLTLIHIDLGHSFQKVITSPWCGGTTIYLTFWWTLRFHYFAFTEKGVAMNICVHVFLCMHVQDFESRHLVFVATPHYWNMLTGHLSDGIRMAYVDSADWYKFAKACDFGQWGCIQKKC